MHIPVKRLTVTAKIPTYGTTGAVGMDLYADLARTDFLEENVDTHVANLQKQVLIQPGERVMIPTGIAMAVPEQHYLRVADRSGLAWKQGLHVLAGVIDPDYRGEIRVILINLGDSQVVIKHGDRIAQGVLEMVRQGSELVDVNELPSTERGAGGFGSTGVR